MRVQQKTNMMIPAAIIIAGGLIAAGVLMRGPSVGTGGIAAPEGHNSNAMRGVAVAAEREEFAAHVFGNPDAPVTIVEFSDYECPFCARLHPTIERVVEESNGGIKWEYRHFPLPNHRSAESAAFSGECIARLAGNDAFWDYSDAAFANQRGLNTAFYEAQAERHNINLDKFRTCVQGKEVREIIGEDYNAAVASGGRGTPHSVLVRSDGTQVPFSGALPYQQIMSLINQ